MGWACKITYKRRAHRPTITTHPKPTILLRVGRGGRSKNASQLGHGRVAAGSKQTHKLPHLHLHSFRAGTGETRSNGKYIHATSCALQRGRKKEVGVDVAPSFFWIGRRGQGAREEKSIFCDGTNFCVILLVSVLCGVLPCLCVARSSQVTSRQRQTFPFVV